MEQIVLQNLLYFFIDQVWLYPMFSGKVSAEDVEKFYNDAEAFEKVEQLLKILKPELEKIHVETCIHDVQPYLSQGESYVHCSSNLMYFTVTFSQRCRYSLFNSLKQYFTSSLICYSF